MKSFLTRITKSRPAAFFAALSASFAIIASSVVFAGFGPERPVFDWNNPDQRVGSTTGPVFNSFINTPTYGDERNFVRIAEVVDGQNPNQADFSETKTAAAGKEYWVRTFVHNDANQTTNDADSNFVGIAKNTRVRVAIAEGLANGVDVMGYVSADNAKPGTVWDTATLANDNQRFAVSYVPGSAVLYNRAHANGVALGDGIVSANGVQIGYDQMNGDLPGCFEYSAYVYVKVKVSAPNLELQKQVRKPGETTWHESVNAKPGETVQWLVSVKNTGSTVQHNVKASDLLPPHVTYVNGTAKWYSAEQNGVEYDINQFMINNGNGGYNFGNYQANGGGFLVRFDTKIKDDFADCSIKISNVAHARSDENPTELTDFAHVTITKDNCKPEQPKPDFRCDLLTIEKLDGRKIRASIKAAATNGATVKTYTYNFGDDTPVLVTDKGTVEHTYAKDGTYQIKSSVTFAVGNETKSDVTGENCVKNVSYTTPTTPQVLPKTGAGDLIGMFAATTVAGTIAHRLFLSRRFGR